MGVSHPFPAQVIAFSWAFGTPVARFVTGVAYVLCTAPFDIGDRCLVVDATAATSEDKGYPIICKEIGPQTTKFMTSWSEQIVVPNHVLAEKVVVNQSRSPVPALRLPVRLSTRATPAELAGFKAALAKYAEANPQAWRSAYLIFVALSHDQGHIELNAWFTSASPGGYHDWATLYADRSRAYEFVHAYIHAADLHFARPVQPVLALGAGTPAPPPFFAA